MRHTLSAILILAFLSPALSQEESYKLTMSKLATWAGMGLGGATWGAREAYHADPYVFERAWGVDPESFWGSKAWKRQYYGNNPENKHKPEWGNITRDFWHASGALSRTFTIGGTFVIGSSKQKFKHKLIDMLIGSAVASVSAWATYEALM